MLKRLSSLAAALLLITSSRWVQAETTHTFVERKIDGAELHYVDNIPVAVLSGTPEQVGRHHAALVKGCAPAALELPRKFARELGLEVFWPFMAQAGRTLVSNTPQRFQHELSAMAAAAQVDEGQLAVANTLLELRRMGCSSLVVEPQRSATGGPLFGRNFDFPTLGELHKFSLVLVYRPEDHHAFVSIGFPGLVGALTGMNDAGLTLATLDVEESADESAKFNPAGTPLAFVFRRVLEECTTVDDAEKLLNSVTPTTWMNLSVCDREHGAVFEITPKHIARRNAEEGLVRCTNHFRTAGLSTGESCDRYEKLLGNFVEPKLDVEEVHARLNAARQDRLTLQTMVFEPRELRLHLALSEPPSSDKPFTQIDLKPLLTGDKPAH
jgi:hypothetical protein